MKQFLKGVVASVAVVAAVAATAQMMNGNDFPFWTVDGALTVKAAGSEVFSNLTASLPVFTDASSNLTTNAKTGTGNVVMSASPTLTGTIGAASITATGTTNTSVLVVATTGTPAASDACTAGKIVWDASYVYVCTATGVWKRAAITGSY